MSYQRRDYRKYRPMPEPTNYPAAITFKGGDLEFDFLVEDRESFETFKINKRVIDGPALKSLASDHLPIEKDEFRTVVQRGKHFRPLFENDGPARTCAICLTEKQPVVTTYFYQKDDVEQEGKGGNLFTRSEKTIREQTSPETQEQATGLTAEIFDGTIPESLFSRAFFVCRQCQYTVNREAEKKGNDPIFTRGFNLSQAKERLLRASERISEVIDEYEAKGRARNIAANLGRQSREHRTERGGQSEDRPRKEKRDWRGVVTLELATADRADQLLAEGGIETPGDLLSLTEEQIVNFGLVEFPEQAPYLRVIFLAVKRRQEESAVVSRVAGTGTAPLGEVVKHGRREREKSRGHGGNKFRKPRRNPKYDYDR